VRIRSFDTSGKTLAEWHHRNEFELARAGRNPRRAFSIQRKVLTRRAKHRHNAIIETSLVHPRGTRSAAGFFVLDFGIGRRRRIAATHSLDNALRERRSARRRPNLLLAVHARTCRPAAPGLLPAPLRSPGSTEIGFAPETIALFARSAAHLFSLGEKMTAYLISLAIAGLVAILLWETLS